MKHSKQRGGLGCLNETFQTNDYVQLQLDGCPAHSENEHIIGLHTCSRCVSMRLPVELYSGHFSGAIAQAAN